MKAKKYIPTGPDLLKDLWCRKVGKEEQSPLSIKNQKPHPTLVELQRTEWCKEFEDLMRNRLVLGSFRYGRIEEQDYSKYNLPAEIKKRTDRYIDSHNLEHLIDAANICMLAFIHGKRQGEKVEAIDDGEHTPEINAVDKVNKATKDINFSCSTEEYQKAMASIPPFNEFSLSLSTQINKMVDKWLRDCMVKYDISEEEQLKTQGYQLLLHKNLNADLNDIYELVNPDGKILSMLKYRISDIHDSLTVHSEITDFDEKE